jgi:PAS domain S-box-containing protein
MNVAKKIIISILTIVIASGLVIVGFVYVSERATIEQLIRRELEGIVIRKIDKIDRFLFERQGDIEFVSQEPVMRAPDADPGTIAERLLALRDAMKAYISLSFFTSDGVRLADTAGLDIGKQRPVDPLWTELAEGAGSVGGVILQSFALKMPVIAFAARVEGTGGEPRGYVIGRVSPNKIYEIAGKTTGSWGVENELEIDLVDEKGLLIYSSHDRKGMYKRDLSGSEWYRMASGGLGSGSVTETDQDGVRRLVVFARETGYLGYRGHGWIMAARVPLDAALRPAKELRDRILLIVLMVFLVAAVISLRISHTISRPIIALHKGTEVIAEGNLDYKVGIKTKDEIGQLSRAFDEMTGKLKTTLASRDELNREIVEREKAEQAVRESEEKYRSLFESSTDAIMLLDRKGFIDCNAATLKMLDLSSKEEFIAKHPAELSSEKQPDGTDSMTAATERIEAAFTKGSELFEWTHRRSDGTMFPAEVLLSRIEFKGEKVLQATVRDITERKREKELLQERMRLSDLAKEAGVALNKTGSLRAVLQESAETIFKSVDAAFVRIWTFDPVENVLELQASAGMYTHIDGGHARVPVGQFKIGLIAQERRPHLTNNVIGDPRVHYQDWAQKEGMVAFAGYPLIVEDQLMGVAALFARHPLSDETLLMLAAVAETLANGIKRKQAEERLEKAYQDLVQTQMKLVQSEKMASVGQLAAGVAHEINNPLAFVMGNLGALKDYRDKLDEYLKAVSSLPLGAEAAREIGELKQKLKIAHIMDDMPNLIKETTEGAERINKIVQGLRSFARPEGGEMRSVEINECVETALNLLMNELKYKADAVKELGKVSAISGYPQQISQVFMNILLNAAQAIEKRGTITIKTYEKGRNAVIEISDTGPGISRMNIKKIFDPFFTTKEIGKGTGLGLSIVHGIVQRHKGTVEVDSEVGKGTTFVVTFPIGY